MSNLDLEAGNSHGVAMRNLEKLRQLDRSSLPPREQANLEALIHKWTVAGEEARRRENRSSY